MSYLASPMDHSMIELKIKSTAARMAPAIRAHALHPSAGLAGSRLQRTHVANRWTAAGIGRSSGLSTGRRAGGTPVAASASSAAAWAPQQQQPEQQPQQHVLAAIPSWLRTAALAAACAAAFSALAAVAAPAATGGSGLFASLALAAGAGAGNIGVREALRSAGAGLAAGCLHTLAGADHLAALTPLTIGRSHLRASLLGALWGFGHSTGQLMLGLAMVLLKDRFTQLVPALTKWGGTAVGVTLLAIGALGIWESFFEQDHHQEEIEEASISAAAAAEVEAKAAASQQRQQQQQFVVQADGTLAAAATSSGGLGGGGAGGKKEKRGFGLATFASGIAFGLQPDALFVIVPALTLPTKLAAAAYICMFVLGTVAAMGAYTGLIGFTSAAIKRNNSGLTQKLSGAASFVALAIGAGMLLGGWGVELPIPFLGGGH